MITLVTKQWYETEDGKQFNTQAEAKTHECVVAVAKVLSTPEINWDDIDVMELAKAVIELGYEFKRIDPQAP